MHVDPLADSLKNTLKQVLLINNNFAAEKYDEKIVTLLTGMFWGMQFCVTYNYVNLIQIVFILLVCAIYRPRPNDLFVNVFFGDACTFAICLNVSLKTTQKYVGLGRVPVIFL